jgi:hypothetical protein
LEVDVSDVKLLEEGGDQNVGMENGLIGFGWEETWLVEWCRDRTVWLGVTPGLRSFIIGGGL